MSTVAYAAVTVIEFLGTLWPAVLPYQSYAAIGLVAAFNVMHAAGVRSGTAFTTVVSTAVGALLLLLIGACWLAPATRPAIEAAGNAPQLLSAGGVLVLVPALRAILTSYDGWYAPIYTAEESVDAARTLPRAIIGGALLVAALYLTLNASLLRVLPIQALAASTLPVASAAQIVLPRGSATVITWLSILMALGLMNGNLLMGTRVLFAMARDGWISPKGAVINRGGTPWAALVITSLLSSGMILSGSFNQILAIFTVLILLYYVAAFLSVFVLRRRLPQAPRPYRAFGYPVSTFIVLAGTVAFLVAAVIDDLRSALMALLLLCLCIPAYAFAARARHARLSPHAPQPG